MNKLKHNVQEFINENIIADKIKNGESIRAYFGIEPRASPNLDCLILLLKLRDLIKLNINITILLADVHSYLSHETTRTQERTAYYSFLIEKILLRIGISRVRIIEHKTDENIDFEASNYEEVYSIIKGSDIQLTKPYISNLFKVSTNVSIKELIDAGSDIFEHDDNPKLSKLIYPLMQVLDETTLEANIQIGDTTQKKIFELSQHMLENLNYDKGAYILMPTIPSKSIDDEPIKLDFLDDKKTLNRKLSKAYIEEKNPDPNHSICIALVKYIIFEVLDEFGPYKSYDEFILRWTTGQLSKASLINYLVSSIDYIIEPIRTAIESHKEIYNNAFS